MKPFRRLFAATALAGMLALVSASALAASVRLGEVELTKIATISNPQPYEKLAAQELAAYFEKISGKRVATTQISGNEVPPGVLAVGTLAKKARLISDSELEPLAPDGFVIRVAKGTGAICGYQDVGTLYGAYAALERCGVRFFAPDCEVIPKRPDLVIAESEERVKPRFEIRFWGNMEKFRNRQINLKLGQGLNEVLGDPVAAGERGGSIHSSSFLVPYQTYGKEHPEYFSLLKDGQRLHRVPGKPFHIHLCTSNPDVRRISTERVLWLMDKQPDRLYFSVAQGDGQDWCECDKCKALDAEAGVDLTDRLLSYVNEVARAARQKHPTKKIVTLAYNGPTSRPPTREKLEPNVLVAYCVYPPRATCHSHDLTCEKNKLALEDLKGWLSRFPGQVYTYDYPMSYSLVNEPFGSFYAMHRKMKMYDELGSVGIGYCHAPASFLDLFIYVQSKMGWDPKIDVEPVIDEFMAAYYGPAAKEIREYFDYMHGEIDRRPVHQHCEGSRGTLVTPEYAEKALAILSRAQAAAASDPTCLARVDREKFCVLCADLYMHNPPKKSVKVSKEEFARRVCEMLRIAKANKIEQIARKDVNSITSFMKMACGIELTAKPWYDDKQVNRLIADPKLLMAK